NPGQADLRAALARRGIRALLSCWRRDRFAVLGREPAAGPGAALTAVRGAALRRLDRLVGAPESDLLGSIVFGLHAGFTPDLLSAFQATGLMHVLVASGLNVGLLAWMCLAALGALGLGRRRASLLTLPVLLAYHVLCGGGTPLLRSTLMFGMLVGAEALGRESSPLNAIGAAALLVLAADPEALWDRSFELSFAATFAVMALGGGSRPGGGRCPAGWPRPPPARSRRSSPSCPSSPRFSAASRSPAPSPIWR
ncbi:MAG: ComEC/Rec2 family competence protein, partial [bacterium]